MTRLSTSCLSEGLTRRRPPPVPRAVVARAMSGDKPYEVLAFPASAVLRIAQRHGATCVCLAPGLGRAKTRQRSRSERGEVNPAVPRASSPVCVTCSSTSTKVWISTWVGASRNWSYLVYIARLRSCGSGRTRTSARVRRCASRQNS